MAEDIRKKKRARVSQSPSVASKRIFQPAEMGEDRPWKLAQLAAILSAHFHLGDERLDGLRINPRIASKETDTHFAAALKRADMLLSWAEGRGGNIHAYQLFSEGEVLTEIRILEFFQAAGWEGLKSKAPVMKLMKKIRGAFEGESQSQEAGYETKAGGNLQDLQNSVCEAVTSAYETHVGVLQRNMSELLRGHVEDLLSTIRERLANHFAEGSQRESFLHIQKADEFFKWCFPEPEPGGETKAERLYRPHEIFRRCAARTWFPPALIRTRDSLSSAFVPYPPADLQREEWALFTQAYEAKIEECVASKSQLARASSVDQPA